MEPTPKSTDILIPIYNEADGLLRFHFSLQSAVSALTYKFRFIYIDDGSSDGTVRVLEELRRVDARVDVIRLSRNFGHQAALSAGLDHADANIVIMMDGDGQHPPELIVDMLRLYEDGYDIVQTQRSEPPGARHTFKAVAARFFYHLISSAGRVRVIEGAADFRLISRQVLEAIRKMPEYHRFLRGIVSWVGFRTVILPYQVHHRIAGKTKYSVRKMLRLASDGLFSFSLVPLHLGVLVGSLFLVLAAIEICFVSGYWFFGKADKLVPGWSSIIILLTLCGGTILLLLGFIGIYVGMIFEEVKRRPVYLIDADRRGSAESAQAIGSRDS